MCASHVAIDVKGLLEFYDARPDSSRGHATAITQVAGEELGLALLRRYFQETGKPARIRDEACKAPGRSGSRLDAWLDVGLGSERTLYQVEVKNWSAHSLDGYPIALSATAAEIQEYKIEAWKEYWDGEAFIQPQLQKVLRPVPPPEKGARVEPLACLWDLVHPRGELEPMFRVALGSRPFPHMTVFSMSSYLRSLRRSRITLQMPHTVARLFWLQRLFVVQDRAQERKSNR